MATHPAQAPASYPTWLAGEERKADRVPVAWSASWMADKFETEPVDITDCTTLGCRVATQRRVSIGTLVTLTIPRFADVVGWVAWSTPQAAGIDFSHPMPNDVLEEVIRRNAAVHVI